MTTPPISFSTAAALIDHASATLGRLLRLAPHATPQERLRLRGELSLVDRAVDDIERGVRARAEEALTAMRRELPTKPEPVAPGSPRPDDHTVGHISPRPPQSTGRTLTRKGDTP